MQFPSNKMKKLIAKVDLGVESNDYRKIIKSIKSISLYGF